MPLLAQCWWVIAAAGVFELPLTFDNGPPPQLPALTRYEPPTFPDSLRLSSIADGYATMMFTIDEEGRVSDSIAIEASHPAFAESMRDVLAKWRFEVTAGVTTPRRELIQFDFRRTGTVSSLSQRDASKAAFPTTPMEHDRPIRTVEWADLMTPPQRLEGSMPRYPSRLREQGVQGFARVHFVIDRQGAVRVPVVIDASDARFGEAALSAIGQWRFAPTLIGDEPVNVRVERTFSFGARTQRR